jgi:hypothetical protein
MKTGSGQTAMTASLGASLASLTAARDLGGQFRRRAVGWQVFRPARRVMPAPEKLVKSLWLAPQRESRGEKLMFGLLAAAAMAAIGYGLVSAVNLAQNWAAFNQGIGRMLQ